MVWINYDCHNNSAPPGVFGGSICMCYKCIAKRKLKADEKLKRKHNMKRQDLKVDQVVYALNINNAATRYNPQLLTPVTIKSIGRKYFYINERLPYCREGKFNIETLFHDSNYPSYKIYLHSQEWVDEKEIQTINSELRRVFGGCRDSDLSLSKLRRIKAILDED